VSLRQWRYRASGQQERDEIAAIRSTAQLFGAMAAGLLPEITALTVQVGIERVSADAADQCTPSRLDSLTGSRWRSTVPAASWRPSGMALASARDHASRAADFAAAAVRAAEHADAIPLGPWRDACDMRFARGDAQSARNLSVSAHHHLLNALAAYDEYVRLLAAELAPADLDTPTPAPVAQPIAAPDWPVRQGREVRP